MLALVLVERHHVNGIPGTAVEESAFRSLACAQLATDAKQGIDFDASEGRSFLGSDPDHAVFHRAVVDTGGRPCTSRTRLIDHRNFLRLAFALRGELYRFLVL